MCKKQWETKRNLKLLKKSKKYLKVEKWRNSRKNIDKCWKCRKVHIGINWPEKTKNWWNMLRKSQNWLKISEFLRYIEKWWKLWVDKGCNMVIKSKNGEKCWKGENMLKNGEKLKCVEKVENNAVEVKKYC